MSRTAQIRKQSRGLKREHSRDVSHDQVQNITQAILRINPDDPDSVQLTEAIQPMWAKSTWNNRTRLWKNVNEFCRVKHREMNSATAILYLQTLRVAPSTRLNYARALHTVFTLMGMECNPLKLFTKAIQAQGGTEPQRQMQPITPPMLQKLCTRLSITQAMTVLLCWKAASTLDRNGRAKKGAISECKFE